MKPSWRTTLLTGTLATVLAVGISLPGSASAASVENNNIKYFTSYNSLTTYLQDWVKSNGGKWTVPVNNEVTITKPTTPVTNPTTKPVTKPVTEPVTEPTTNDTSVDKSDVTSQVVNLVNQERSKAGLKSLVVDSKLASMALDKAKDMNNNNYFAHQSPTFGSPFDMMKQYGISYSYAGENIAKGQKTPADVMQAWMNSEGHRANILSANFTTIGVGYYNGHWVQEFISK